MDGIIRDLPLALLVYDSRCPMSPIMDDFAPTVSLGMNLY